MSFWRAGIILGICAAAFPATRAAADPFEGACRVSDIGIVSEQDQRRLDAKAQEILRQENLVSIGFDLPIAAKTGEVFRAMPVGNYVRVREVFGVDGNCRITQATTESTARRVPLRDPFRLIIERQTSGGFETVSETEGRAWNGRAGFDQPGIYRFTVEMTAEVISAFNVPRRSSRTVRISAAVPRAEGIVELKIVALDGSRGSGVTIDPDGASKLALNVNPVGICRRPHGFDAKAVRAEILSETTGSQRSRNPREERFSEGLWELRTSSGTLLSQRQGGDTFQIFPERLGDGGYRLSLSLPEPFQPAPASGFRTGPASLTIRIQNCGAGTDPEIARARETGRQSCVAETPDLEEGETDPRLAAIQARGTPREICQEEDLILPDLDIPNAPFENPEVAIPLEQVIPNFGLKPEDLIAPQPAPPGPVPLDLLAECAALEAEIARRKAQEAKSCAPPLEVMLRLIGAPGAYTKLRGQYVDLVAAAATQKRAALLPLALELRALEQRYLALAQEAREADLAVNFGAKFFVADRFSSLDQAKAHQALEREKLAKLRADLAALDDREKVSNQTLTSGRGALSDFERFNQNFLREEIAKITSTQIRAVLVDGKPDFQFFRERNPATQDGVPPTLTRGGLNRGEFLVPSEDITDPGARERAFARKLARGEEIRAELSEILGEHNRIRTEMLRLADNLTNDLAAINEQLQVLHGQMAALAPALEADKDLLAEMFASNRFEHCIGGPGGGGVSGFQSVAAGQVQGARGLAAGLPGMNVTLPDPGPFTPLKTQVNLPKPLTELQVPGLENVLPLQIKRDGLAQEASERTLFRALAETEQANRNSAIFTFLEQVQNLTLAFGEFTLEVGGELGAVTLKPSDIRAIFDASESGQPIPPGILSSLPDGLSVEELKRTVTAAVEQKIQATLTDPFDRQLAKPDVQNFFQGIDTVLGTDFTGKVDEADKLRAGQFLELVDQAAFDSVDKLLSGEERDRLAGGLGNFAGGAGEFLAGLFGGDAVGDGAQSAEDLARAFERQQELTSAFNDSLDAGFVLLDVLSLAAGGANVAKAGGLAALLDDGARLAASGLLTKNGREAFAEAVGARISKADDLAEAQKSLIGFQHQIDILVAEKRIAPEEAQALLDALADASVKTAEQIAKRDATQRATAEIAEVAARQDQLVADAADAENALRAGDFANNEGEIPDFARNFLADAAEAEDVADLEAFGRRLFSGEAFSDGTLKDQGLVDFVKPIDGENVVLGERLGAGQNSSVSATDRADVAVKVVDQKAARHEDIVKLIEIEQVTARLEGREFSRVAVEEALEAEFGGAGKIAPSLDDVIKLEDLEEFQADLIGEGLNVLNGEALLREAGIPHQRLLGIGQRE
ncbi:MAG: hypothetical protein AAGI13_13600, partial [Pseudomonadota bacterium]